MTNRTATRSNINSKRDILQYARQRSSIVGEWSMPSASWPASRSGMRMRPVPHPGSSNRP